MQHLAFFLSRHRNSFVSDAVFCCTFDGITAISRQIRKYVHFKFLLDIRHFGKKCQRKIFSTDFCVIKLLDKSVNRNLDFESRRRYGRASV